jgi:hypothetical protein
MKIVKTYNQVVNESLDKDNIHLLTDEQIRWCVDNLEEGWRINFDGEIYYTFGRIEIHDKSFDRCKIKFADCKNFILNNNPELVSLEGFPNKVREIFSIRNCKNLESLVGGPTWVGEGYTIDKCNSLINLNGAPEYVGESFDVSWNNLQSLEGSPNEVGGFYFARKNILLVNLKGITQNIGGDLYIGQCSNLKSLDGLNKDFPSNKIYASECKIPEEELIYNWQNDINQDEIDQFKQDWEI